MRRIYVAESGNDTNPGTESLPLRTISRVNTLVSNYSINRGDKVLFRAGDTFYGGVNPPPGGNAYGPVMEFGSYGGGNELPVLSRYKILNNPDAWTLTATANVWQIDLSLTAGNGGGYAGMMNDNADVGFLKVDSEIFGDKRTSLASLTEQWRFYSDRDAFVLYVYSVGKPTTLAADIRASTGSALVQPRNATLVNFLTLEGSSWHGAFVEEPTGILINAEVSDCVIREIGGGYQPATANRFGNGVEVMIGAADIDVKRNHITDIYDVATTMQGTVSSGRDRWARVNFEHNLIERANQAFEIWATGSAPSGGFIKTGFRFNDVRNSGRSWGEKWRGDTDGKATDLLAYSLDLPVDVQVTDNSFYGAKETHLYSNSDLPAGYIYERNTVTLAAGTKIEYQRTQTVEQSAAWKAATGKGKGCTFVPIPTGDDLAAALGANAARSSLALAAPKPRRRARLPLNPERVLGQVQAPLLSGRFYTQPFTTMSSAASIGNGDMLLAPLACGRSAMAATLAVQVVTAGSAGALVRLGLYRWEDSLTPRLTKIIDAGTVDASTVGVKSLAAAVSLRDGETVWLAACVQGAPATLPFLRTATGGSIAQVDHASAALALAQAAPSGLRVAGVSGALPDTVFPTGAVPAVSTFLVALGVAVSA